MHMFEFTLQHPLITMIVFWIVLAGTVSILARPSWFFKAIFGKSCNNEQHEDD